VSASASIVSVDTSGASSAPSLVSCLSDASEDADASLCAIGSAALASADDARAALDVALKRGFWGAAGSVIDSAIAGAWDVSTTLNQRSSAIRKSLGELSERLSATHTSTDIPPSFEYAQSPKFVFISVKWALGRAPSTLGCVPSAPAYSGRNVSFRAVCAEKRKTFALKLYLWGNVTAESSSWSEASVGRATLTIAKTQEGPWPRLLADSTIKTQLWWCVALDSRCEPPF
jgi:hypothetical protein